jgi:arginase family enzyme
MPTNFGEVTGRGVSPGARMHSISKGSTPEDLLADNLSQTDKREAHMNSSSGNQVFFRTDQAWDFLAQDQMRGLRCIDVEKEARALRFITSQRRIEAFAAAHEQEFRPFTLFGSGDFHHLSAVWTRQFTEPFSILSFDNHPDWDIRPPRWSCGAWINRAFENPLVQGIAVWGCGNFECNFPGRLLGNRSAAKMGRLLVHPWQQRGRTYPGWLNPMRTGTWRDDFTAWLENAEPTDRVYVTIDLDCLESALVFTNWEQGRYNFNDIEWALAEIRKYTHIIGGDLCGSWSPSRYATPFQSMAGWFDHPHVPTPAAAALTAKQNAVFRHLWPALTGLQPGGHE